MQPHLVDLFEVVITPWKIVGYLGILLFTVRWIVQVLATRLDGRPVIPPLFWMMSMAGSTLLLCYFIWGRLSRYPLKPVSDERRALQLGDAQTLADAGPGLTDRLAERAVLSRRQPST
jgi:hypothetical protein